MIADDVADEVAAKCGLTGAGLYMKLERLVGPDGSWVCTVSSLATACGCSDRHIQDTAKRLETEGFLERTPVLAYGGATIGLRWFLPKHIRTYGGEPHGELGGEPSREPVLGVVVTSSLQKEEISPKTKKAPEYTSEFLAFWKAYPSGHGVKVKAFEEWQKLRPDAELQAAIIAAIDGWRLSEKWQKGFIRDAERFLSYRLWEDIPPPMDGQITSAPLPAKLLHDIEADIRSHKDMRKPVPEARLKEHEKWIDQYRRTGVYE